MTFNDNDKMIIGLFKSAVSTVEFKKWSIKWEIYRLW
jgi:hypothetical protein